LDAGGVKSWFARIKQLFSAGKGRPAAAAFLLWLVGTNFYSELRLLPTWNDSIPGQALRIAAKPFNTGRQILFDEYQRTFPRQPQSQPVTIVAIDEQSLKQIGQWPWPRNQLADLIDAIARHQPAAIGLDMYMPERDQTSPDRVAANLSPQHAKLAKALSALPSHETRLAESLRAVPSVLGATGFDFATFSTSSGLRTAPLVVHGEDAVSHLENFPFVLASLPELQAAASGQALLTVTASEAGVVRRVPLVLAVNEQPVPGLALEMLRVASGSSAIEIHADRYGIQTASVADLVVPTQPDGDFWLHFARAESTSARVVSAADVLSGKVDPDRLAGRLVLLGLTGFGLSDLRTTALGEVVPGIEIQAQVIEAMFDQDFIGRPWWLKWLETGIILLCGGLMIWLIPSTDNRFAAALKTAPKTQTWVVVGLNVVMIGAGYALFRSSGLMLDAASMFICLSPVLGSLISSAMIEIDRQTEQLSAERQVMREAAARVAAEMSAARRIQLGSLPNAVELFRGETRFEITAMLEPAREIGGDLYDFFMIDEHRLGFVIGDVSGKGLPASLFMASTKTLIRSISMRTNSGPGEVLTLVNAELARENPESLFVTLLLGVLDVNSGVVDLVNAGHDAPWRVDKDGVVVRVPSPDDCGGPPICIFDDFSYTSHRLQLAVGEKLCLVTDGVTEAMNLDQELYGAERLTKLFSQFAPGEAPNVMQQRLKEDVAGFVETAEASDDITAMFLSWHGGAT
jgi:adenylate cyclase